jgi:hypothetical protein
LDTAGDRLHRAGDGPRLIRAGSEGASYLAGALGGTRTPNLPIRRSGQVVQDRPSLVVGWADIPELSTCVGRRPAAWLQSWDSTITVRMSGIEDVTSTDRDLVSKAAVAFERILGAALPRSDSLSLIRSAEGQWKAQI